MCWGTRIIGGLERRELITIFRGVWPSILSSPRTARQLKRWCAGNFPPLAPAQHGRLFAPHTANRRLFPPDRASPPWLAGSLQRYHRASRFSVKIRMWGNFTRWCRRAPPVSALAAPVLLDSGSCKKCFQVQRHQRDNVDEWRSTVLSETKSVQPSSKTGYHYLHTLPL